MIAEAASKVLTAIAGIQHKRAPLLLVGGTALSLQLQHRESYDLDFAWLSPTSGDLDRRLIDGVVGRLTDQQHSVTDVTDFATLQDWENDGFDLRDAQQDFQIDGVKVTFFVAHFDPDDTQAAARQKIGNVELATPTEIFWLKSGVTAERFRSRDAYDLAMLMDRFGLGLDDYLEGLRRCHVAHAAQTAINRLAACRPPPGDPGISTDINFEELRPALAEKFAALRDQYERSVAASTLHSEDAPGL